MLYHGRHDVFAHRHGGKKCAILEHHAPAPLNRNSLLARGLVQPLAEHVDLACVRRVETNDGTQQHGFARARSADDAQDLASLHFKVEPFVHGLGAEAVREAAHADDDVIVIRGAARGRVARLVLDESRVFHIFN